MIKSTVTEVNHEEKSITFDTEAAPAPWYWQVPLRCIELFLLMPKPAWLSRCAGKVGFAQKVPSAQKVPGLHKKSGGAPCC
jgi:hypothetical protein